MNGRITIEQAKQRAHSTAERYQIAVAVIDVEGKLYIQTEDEYRPDGHKLIHVAVPKSQLH